ncbi:Uncharacterised protein [Vibrio cholerae]|nr:Uncharacterised protein [Vibrio cholerae]CSC68953.1 Uncharacterised protein [Vibrio cholerae]CSC83385.1 Uncharacterised protein [Vibrio cholerae]
MATLRPRKTLYQPTALHALFGMSKKLQRSPKHASADLHFTVPDMKGNTFFATERS